MKNKFAIIAAVFLGFFLAGPPVFAWSDGIKSGIYYGSNSASGGSVSSSQQIDTQYGNSNNSSDFGDDTNGQQSQSKEYAALGDSVAAGLGLAPLPNQTSEDKLCGRSSQAYPALVAQQTGMQLNFLACSGATLGDLVTNNRAGGYGLEPQLDRAYANGVPRLITITAGANDVNWVRFLTQCYRSNCATPANERVAANYINQLGAKYKYVFEQIQNRSNNQQTTVVVTGYYNPVSN